MFEGCENREAPYFRMSAYTGSRVNTAADLWLSAAQNNLLQRFPGLTLWLKMSSKVLGIFRNRVPPQRRAVMALSKNTQTHTHTYMHSHEKNFLRELVGTLIMKEKSELLASSKTQNMRDK